MERDMFAFALALLCASLLATLAQAEVSQQQAGVICNAYSSEGETIQVVGPITCEGGYWLCDFTYYGNSQNLLIPVGTDGSVLGADNDLLGDLLSVKYAVDYGSTYLFGTPLSDESFAIQLRGMNATLQNYAGILKSLRGQGTIDKKTLDDFNTRIDSLQDSATSLAGDIIGLSNMSEEFLASPDCVELLDYDSYLNRTLTLAKNFSSSWSGFIERYNTMAKSAEIYVASINPSDAQILERDIAGIEAGLAQYRLAEDGFKAKVASNLETRYDRKEARDRLDQAYGIVSGSSSEEAISKYNDASAAFNQGGYQDARNLAAEAIALASAVQPDNNGGQTTAKAPADYSFYFILIGAMLAVILAVTLLKRRVLGGEDNEEEDIEERKADKKPKAKKSWTWVKEDESSMEKKASERLLDS